MPKITLFAKKFVNKQALEEIVERLMTKPQAKGIPPQMTREIMDLEGSPFTQRQPSSLITIKGPQRVQGESPDFGLEEAVRFGTKDVEATYATDPEAYSLGQYGVSPTTSTRRVRHATPEDAPEDVIGGKIVYEEEESITPNMAKYNKEKLMATPIAQVISDEQRAAWFWNMMTAKKIGDVESRTLGRSMWTSFHNSAIRNKNREMVAKTPVEYFKSNFIQWRHDPKGYAAKSKLHKEQASMLEQLWQHFKPAAEEVADGEI